MIPDYDIRIDWNADGDFDGTGEDVTGRINDRGPALQLRYGRDQARAFSPLAGGSGAMELNNDSRDYSPENTASPLAGLVQPGRDVRIRATLDGVTYGLMRAHLDDYVVIPDRERRGVRLSLLDGLARLRGVEVSTPLYHSVRTGQAIGLLLDAVGWPADARDLDVGATTIRWWWLSGTDALSALQAILDAEGPGSLATVDIDGRLVFRDRHHRLLRARSQTAQATYRTTGTVEPLISPPMAYHHGWREIVNSVTFDIPVRVPSGQLSQVWQMSGQRALADGETVTLSARSSDPFVGAIAPVAGTDFEALAGTVRTTLTRTSGQDITVLVTAEGGPAVINGMAVRAYPIDTQTTVHVEAEDSTSIADVGRRSWPSGRAPTWASLPDAIAIANMILAYRARRLPTVSITLRGGGVDRLREQLARDLSDRVRIVDPETGLDADFWVEQIEHSSSRLDHTTTFGCEQIPTPAGNPFTFDRSGRGFDQGTFGDIGRDDPATVFIFDHPTQGCFDVGLFAN
ncbi:hypothetical protein ACIBJE_02040 [Micromonospora sp. NPDC050187]|uniref:hypothetical protein n=1 Tax=Micromonospora sp. NPDC050187 TaxID=3364277 RepID=UPI0037B10004